MLNLTKEIISQLLFDDKIDIAENLTCCDYKQEIQTISKIVNSLKRFKLIKLEKFSPIKLFEGQTLLTPLVEKKDIENSETQIKIYIDRIEITFFDCAHKFVFREESYNLKKIKKELLLINSEDVLDLWITGIALHINNRRK